jgi:hypothetical protein
MIEKANNKFVCFNLVGRGRNDDSLELDSYIICINGTNGPINKKFTFRFKNN